MYFTKRFKDLLQLWIALWSIFSLLTLRQSNFVCSRPVWCLCCALLWNLWAEIFKRPSGDSTFLARIDHKNTLDPFNASSLFVFQSLLSQHAAGNGKGQAEGLEPTKHSGIWLHLNSKWQWRQIIRIKKKDDVGQSSEPLCLGFRWWVWYWTPVWPWKNT